VVITPKIKKFAQTSEKLSKPYIRKIGPTWKVIIGRKGDPLFYYGSFLNKAAAETAGKKEYAKLLKVFTEAREGFLNPTELKEYLKKNHKVDVSLGSIKRGAEEAGFEVKPGKAGSFSLFRTPTEEQVNNLKANQLKASGSTEAGKKAFKVREKRAKQLLKTKKYSVTEANEILKTEFPEIKTSGMKSTLTKLAKNIKGIPSGREGETATVVKRIKTDLIKLNNSNIKKLLNEGVTDLNRLGNETAKLLKIDKDLGIRRIGQLIEAHAGDDRYLKIKNDAFLRRIGPLIKGLGQAGNSKLFGGIGSGLQRMFAESTVAKDLGKIRSFFSSLRKRISEMVPSSEYETDEIKNIRSSARFRTSPYSAFIQGIRADINQDKGKTLDKQTSIYEKRLQAAKTISEKKKIATEYNDKARKFALDANKNLKPGQLPVRTLEFKVGVSPNVSIKNKTALNNYGDLFDEIYQKHNYSMSVPEDVKSVDEIRPFLQGGRGKGSMLKLLAQRAPRIFGIPAAAYLGYQALPLLTGTPVAAAEIQRDAQGNVIKPKVNQPAVSEPLKYDATQGSIVNLNTDQKADQNQILQYVKDNPLKVTAGTSLGFAAQEVPGAYKAARDLGRGRVRSTLGISGAIRPILTTFGTPLLTGLYEGAIGAKRLEDGETMTDILTDPLGPALGISLMEPLTKMSGAVRSAQPTGIMGGIKQALNLRDFSNVGTARPGLTSQILRMGLSPKVIAGVSRGGLYGLIAASALSAGKFGLDQYDKYQNQEGMIYNLFND